MCSRLWPASPVWIVAQVRLSGLPEPPEKRSQPQLRVIRRRLLFRPWRLVSGNCVCRLGWPFKTPSLEKQSPEYSTKIHSMVQFLVLLIGLFAATQLQAQTGLLFDDVYLKHLSGNTGHPERPERLIAIRDG